MTLSTATLKSGLEAMVPTDSESDAIQAFVDAWDGYFAGASVMGTPATAGSYAAGLSAMQAALVGMSQPNAAAAKMQTGVTAFWTAIMAMGPAIWLLAPPPVVLPVPIVPPPGIAGIAAALTAAWSALAANANVTLADAAQATANVLGPSGGMGAMCSVLTVPAPPTIVVTPIL